MIPIKIYSPLNVELATIAVASSAVRTEKLNSDNILNFSIRVKDAAAAYINDINMVGLGSDRFDIAWYKKEQASDGKLMISVECEHVSYRLNNDEYNKTYYYQSDTPANILADLLAGTDFAVGTVEFTDQVVFDSSLFGATEGQAMSRRSLLMQFVNQLSGELAFSGFVISILTRRGSAVPVELTVGKDVTVISEAVDKRNCDSEGDPARVYTLSVYKGAALSLGDAITVAYSSLGISTTLRIVSKSYDPYNPNNVTIEVGNYAYSLEDTLYDLAFNKVSRTDLSLIKDAAVDLNTLVANSLGYFQTVVTDLVTGAKITYMHDQATLEASLVIYVMTEAGLAWTDQGWNGGSPTWQYGITGAGNAIFKTLSALGINANFIHIEAVPTLAGSDARITLDGTDGLAFYQDDGAGGWDFRGGVDVKDDMLVFLTQGDGLNGEKHRLIMNKWSLTWDYTDFPPADQNTFIDGAYISVLDCATLMYGPYYADVTEDHALIIEMLHDNNMVIVRDGYPVFQTRKYADFGYASSFFGGLKIESGTLTLDGLGGMSSDYAGAKTYHDITQFFRNSATNVGTICINFGKHNVMLDAEIDIQSYTYLGNLHVRGYTYMAGATWHNFKATQIHHTTLTAAARTIRTANATDGSRCVLIGITTTDWQGYLAVSVPKMTLGYGMNLSMIGDVTVSLITDESGYTNVTAVTPNDGTNADLLDGYHADVTAAVSTIALRNAAGSIYMASANLSIAPDNLGTSHYHYEYNSDGFIRRKTIANVRTDIVTKAAIEAALTGSISTHSHVLGSSTVSADQLYTTASSTSGTIGAGATVKFTSGSERTFSPNIYCNTGYPVYMVGSDGSNSDYVMRFGLYNAGSSSYSYNVRWRRMQATL